MKVEQRAIRFSCHGSMLYGVLTVPERAARRGVLIVVGGPQYRIGSHRQFMLLAHFLAARGTPVMRFDYRGMGDSEGERITFEDIDEDIRHALDEFFAQMPGLSEVVMWGLCDAASASLFYAHRDPRVAGLVLLNPWVRTEEGAARTYLKHYYMQRLTSRDFWTKALCCRLNVEGSVRSFIHLVTRVRPFRFKSASAQEGRRPNGMHSCSLPERMRAGLGRFQGPVLLLLSGNDLTAKEFSDCASASEEWRKLLEAPRVAVRHLPDANHTFARPDWRNEVARLTLDWIASW